MNAIARFLFDEAELLDAADYDAWIDLFTMDARYWVPLHPTQTDPLGEVSLYYEDLALMQARIGRLRHPRAMGLPVRTSHLIGNIIDRGTAQDGARIITSRFQMTEYIADTQRHYAGKITHHLIADNATWRIRLKRIDLANAGTAFNLLQTFF